MTLLIVAGVGYVGSKLIPVYWSYLSMQDPVKEAAMAASRPGKEAEVRTDLIARAKSVGVMLDEENVEIDRDGNFVTVRVAWEVPVDMRLYRRTLRFRIEKAAPAP
ncbi:MAG: hypothetical protein A2Z31_00665 [candidate division NC10 bacterium RBG_16_65_8]|nr:MAG: hypothetical protein A2Z31_00665 [candidate division NC10 bacterium RBG_16_65_8]